MKWTIKICRIYGVDVRVHVTFALLIGWVAFIFWRQEQTITASIMGVFFILAVFLCVVLHEFGHALAAGRYGIKTRDIILLPIGGAALLERMPTNPLHELWVALAGPAVNIVIAAVLFTLLKLTASLEPLQTLSDDYITLRRRLERFILWPTGVLSSGAMRQWGRHSVAFAGRRHFDDPFFMDRMFVEFESR